MINTILIWFEVSLFCSIFILSRESDSWLYFGRILTRLEVADITSFPVDTWTSSQLICCLLKPPSRDNHRNAPYLRTEQHTTRVRIEPRTRYRDHTVAVKTAFQLSLLLHCWRKEPYRRVDAEMNTQNKKY